MRLAGPFRELLRAPAALEIRLHGPSFDYSLDECVELRCITRKIALKEIVLQQRLPASAFRCPHFRLGVADVARRCQAQRAEHFDPLVIAVCGSAAAVDLAERAAFEANQCLRRIRVARAPDFRIDQIAAHREHFRFADFAGHPKSEVEIVNHLVEELSAGHRKVFRRRRGRVSADNRDHLGFPDRAGIDHPFDLGMGPVESTLKADHDRNGMRPQRFFAFGNFSQVKIDRFFAKDRFSSLRGDRDEFRMGLGR